MSDTTERVKKIVVEHLGIDESKVNASDNYKARQDKLGDFSIINR